MKYLNGSGPSEPHLYDSTTTDGLPVAPALSEALKAARVPHQATLVDTRVLLISLLTVIIGLVSAFVAVGLTSLIDLITNLAFYGRLSFHPATPAGHHLGLGVVVVPVIGGLIVGVMARYGSTAIRGHGIPEAMETILSNKSRIPPRLLFLKPLSAAVAIGTGGPFGAEGPIIATGGALGSLVGQVWRVTAVERKTLLAAGAAAGMAAIFGTPVAAVVLAMELLLFEFRPRSIIPVALASVTATAVRQMLVGSKPVFAMPHIQHPGGEALAFYVLLGALIGVVAVLVTRLVYFIEDAFEKLPIHWMWWPAIGGVVVGLVGVVAPRTLGVGYENIGHVLDGSLTGTVVLVLCFFKLISWSISLGSGTSGGTLAPLFTIGGGFGSAIGSLFAAWLPGAGIDPRVAGMVGMAALFAGASRALLASVIFTFELTWQPMGLLPLLGGCAASYLVSCLLMQNTIMTEKIARRGVKVPTGYGADYMEQVHVRDVATTRVIMLQTARRLSEVRAWMASDTADAHHQGYPVIGDEGVLLGVVTRRDLLNEAYSGDAGVGELVKRAPVVVYEDDSLRMALDHMVREDVGRLPVIRREKPEHVWGILTRQDLLSAHAKRLEENHHKHRSIRLGGKVSAPVSSQS